MKKLTTRPFRRDAWLIYGTVMRLPISALHLHPVLFIDHDPDLFSLLAHHHFHFPERRFQPGDSITTCDGDRAASVVAACLDPEALLWNWLTIEAAGHTNDQGAFQQHVVFEG
jgi:hypothetical protein